MKYLSLVSVFFLLGCGEIVQDTTERSEEYVDTMEQSLQDARDAAELGNQYNSELETQMQNAGK